MKKLSQTELDQKIAAFLDDRLRAHPELGSSVIKKDREGIVSRVKQATRRFGVHRSVITTLYQS